MKTIIRLSLVVMIVLSFVQIGSAATAVFNGSTGWQNTSMDNVVFNSGDWDNNVYLGYHTVWDFKYNATVMPLTYGWASVQSIGSYTENIQNNVYYLNTSVNLTDMRYYRYSPTSLNSSVGWHSQIRIKFSSTSTVQDTRFVFYDGIITKTIDIYDEKITGIGTGTTSYNFDFLDNKYHVINVFGFANNLTIVHIDNVEALNYTSTGGATGYNRIDGLGEGLTAYNFDGWIDYVYANYSALAYENRSLTGNLTAWHTFGEGRQGSQVRFNFTNATGLYIDAYASTDNFSSSNVLVISNVTNATLIDIPSGKNQTQYVRAVLKGNITNTPEVIEITIRDEASGGIAPTITSWSNNKTNNQNLSSITINTSELINFNATANNTPTYSWNIDGIDQLVSYDNFTTSWSTTGTRIVQVNASNEYGQDYKNWTIYVVHPNLLGDNYYISPSGNDSLDGLTIDTAFFNLSYAISVINAGDTVYVINGTYYNETHIQIIASGNASHPIKITSYNETPVFQNDPYYTCGSPAAYTEALDFNWNDYITISNLIFRNYDGFNIQMGSDITLDNITYEDSGASLTISTGIGEGSKNNTLKNSIIRNVAIDCRGPDQSIYYANKSYGWNSIQLQGMYGGTALDNSSNITIQNNKIYDNNMHNLIDMIGYQYDITIKDNELYNGAYAVLYTHGNETINQVMERVYFYNNTIHDIQVNVVTLSYMHDSLIYNNTFYNIGSGQVPLTSTTIYPGIYPDNLTIFNNTIYNTSSPMTKMWLWSEGYHWINISGVYTNHYFTGTTLYYQNNISSYESGGNGIVTIQDNIVDFSNILSSASIQETKYTGNYIFNITKASSNFVNESSLNCYPTFCNYSLQSNGIDNTITYKKLNITLQPSQNNVTATNTTSVLSVNYQNNIIPRLNITFDSPIPNMNLTLNNVTTGANYSLYYSNDTWIDSTIASSPVYFNLSLPNGGYYITEELPPTYNISGYVNNTLGSPIDTVSVVNGTNSTTTNAIGYYTILMTNGTWNFSYSKTGYATGYRDITVTGADVVNQNVTLTANVPNITSWSNNKTNNASLSFTVNVSEAVNFNATANQTITTWTWKKDGADQSQSFNNITVNWTTSGTKYVDVACSNANGTCTNPQNWTVTVSSLPVTEYVPPSPISLAQTNSSTGFWINYTWQADSGNITDSYNVSMNGTWTNESSQIWNNGTITPHGWRNISVYAFNSSGTGTLNQTPVSMNTQIQNNAPAISFIAPTPANASTNTTGSVQINTTVSDADSDNMTALLNWNNSLVGWWRMNEAAGGTLVQDFSGYGNNGTWVGNTTSNVTTGRFGNALAFDGVDDYIDAGNDASLNIADAITVSLWINHISGQAIISHYSVNKGWSLYSNVFGIYTTNGGVDANVLLIDNQWEHLVGVYDGSFVKMYHNGGLYHSAPQTGKIIASGVALTIAAYSHNVGGVKMAGSIDEVRIYNRALSAAEINASYNAGLYRLNTTISGLSDGTYNYTAYVQDAYGTIGQTETRYVTVDTTPPASITALTNTTGNFYHNWTWTNPADVDFNHTMIYINGSFKTNTSNKYYNLTANAHNQSTISTHTVDIVGNVNQTWVNHTSIIPNNVPANITLLTPTNGSTITSIPTNLTWGIGVDNDSDVLTYSLKVNGSIVLTGITTNYTLYNLSSGNNNWSVRSYDGYVYSNWSNIYNLRYNLVNFSFTNKSVSETQIYQSSQSTRIKVDVNDSDGYINNVSVGITFNSVQTNYTMSGGNDTWIYDFKSGVPGVYSVSNFYATDNASGINSSTSTLQFIVVPVISGGSSAPAPIVTPTPIVTISIPTTTDISKYKVQQILKEEKQIQSLKEFLFGIGTEFSALPREMQWVMYMVMFIGLVTFMSDKKRRRY